MHYPSSLQEIQHGFSLYMPDPQKVKRIYEQLIVKDPMTPFPYWAQIWPSAIALTSYLENDKHWILDKRIVEIGAGIGLPSFTMAQYAAEMIISDHAPEAVELMEKNIDYLQLKQVKAVCLDWNALPDEMQVDTLLLSDINYAPDQFEAVLFMLRKFLALGTTIILATPQRITVTPFAEAIQPYIKMSILKTVPHLMQTVEIRIVVLQNV